MCSRLRSQEPVSKVAQQTFAQMEPTRWTVVPAARNLCKIVAVQEDEVDFDDNSAIGFEDQMETVEVRDKEKVTKDLIARTHPDQ